ncbi:M28 family metallopeptidase [Sphingobacterium yanglingense]|uniref:Zn-dependent M28 family amino/carboxypeptidase n=1 Tax=Sphingobacterium yanglingense TaxID=1437280 RepID=A0A4R6WKX1_9SPHI|nr:M28 family metallopeptidase [Sphingobacterium yanglingense]TDQ76461.1 Zn-dependent M28 family amino/carboxypeptidase [Sphingobacterium yanglingense]
MNNQLFIILSTFFICIGCTQTNNTSYDASGIDSAAIAAINMESYANNVANLASDKFEGRMPFTKGDSLTVDYIKNQFIALGLQPGNGDSFFQEVPMVEISSKPITPTLTFKGKNGSLSAQYLDDYVIGTRRLEDHTDIASTDLVFAGFGIVAPEYNWNDYTDLDVKGKTVVVLASDPGHYDKQLFKADTMTYYGRWTYKFEEAGRQGAAGVLIIHDTKAASYGWDVVRSGWSGPQMDLDDKNTADPKPQYEGWISAKTAQQLFKLAGISIEAIESAKKPGFKAIPLAISTSVQLKNTLKHAKSNNVIAKIEGTKRADETIIYTAHWDHLGIGEAVNGDSIYNGAIDNAAGVSALFEIARAFQSAKVKPERTIIFMAVTAEEQGLLGSAHYSNNPIYPINKTVANLNMDAFSPLGETKDVSIVGFGQTEIDDYVIQSANKFGRTVHGEKNPTSGGFYRSDHFNFVKKGIPGLFMGSGTELVSTDTIQINKRRAALSNRYHAPSDELDDNWDFEGIRADIKLFFDIGYTLSMEKTFPQFKIMSEFRELGEKRLTK